ncbi:MAG: DUF4416 family protein [Deltaproteobacteria bacterium]|nr:DUF4416 family protein [Deltaproteobacteria bacterium]
MSIPGPPKLAKLVIGLFLKEKSLAVSAAETLSEQFGPVDMVSSWMPFDFTDYYESEMGNPLFRRLLSFKKLIAQRELAEIKWATNDLEHNFSKNGKRRVNIDPGYLLLERFVLATGKNFTHRIYIGRHIYADLTLIYTKGRFQKLPWTYPDYSDEKILKYLERVRNKYVADLRQVSSGEKRP